MKTRQTAVICLAVGLSSFGMGSDWVINPLKMASAADSPTPASTDPAGVSARHGEAPGYKTRNGMQALVSHFEQLVKQNPNDWSAQTGLSEASTLLWCYGFVPRDEVFPTAKAAAMRAVQLDDKRGPAHTALGAIRLMDWEWAEAEREFQRGIELSPNDPKCRHWYGMYLAAMGRHTEALEQSRRAVKLDSSFGYSIGLGAVLYFAGDWQEMAESLQKTIELAPTSDAAHDWLGMALVQEKRFDESIRVYRKAVALSGGAAEVTAGLGHAYGVAGRRTEAAQILKELDELSERWYVPPVQIAYVCAGLGQDDRVFQLLEKAYEEKSWELVFVRTEPWFEHLHAAPRFANLVRRMKFPPTDQ